MRDDMKHRVLPCQPNPQLVYHAYRVPLSDYETKNVKGLGAGIGFFIGVVVYGVTGVLSESVPAGILAAGFAVAIAAIATKSRNVSDLERDKSEQAKENEIQRVENEATSLTSHVTRTYELSATITTELPRHLNQASRLLREAEAEYKDSAFAPFWDAVEDAAKQLAAFNDKTNQLSKNAVEYYRTLGGRKHTFPAFPVKSGPLLDASSVVNELRRIVRMGQTNFQFANIWEHRKTREVLIAGFRTLGEAVNNLGATIEYSVSNLQQSISSDIANLVEEGIRTREALDKRMVEQNRMLDNIQHHRKPQITDRPSR